MAEFEGQEKLEELRRKEPSSLSEADRAFLTARRSYLQAHERAAFGIPEDEAPVDEAQKTQRPSKGLTVAELQEALTNIGIEFAPDAKRAHLAALLDNVSDEDEDEE